MNRYTIGPGGCPDWASRKTIEIGISLNNPAHEGEKLFSILYWASKRFQTCIITLSDTLYRHNLIASGMDNTEAYILSRKMGDEWLASNMSVIWSVENIQIVLNRWDDWRTHPDFEIIEANINDFYNRNRSFRTELDMDVRDYIQRRQGADTAAKETILENCCRAYLIEELAAYVLIARTWKSLRAYPSNDLRCFKYLRSGEIPLNLRGLELSPHLNLNFKKKINKHQQAA